MSRSAKIVGGFAAIGFFLPLVMLAYYAFSGTGAGSGFALVCPSCIASMALDSASTLTGLVVWFFICVINAILYALPGIGIALLVNLRNSN